MKGDGAKPAGRRSQVLDPQSPQLTDGSLGTKSVSISSQEVIQILGYSIHFLNEY